MVLTAVLLGGAWAAWHATFGRPVGPPPKPAPPGRSGEVVPALVHLPSGTDVGDGVPAGWSHVVLKTRTRLESGDVATLPDFARETATRFRTVVLADVRPGASGYTLRRVGVGLALVHRDREVVVASGALDRMRVPASLLDRLVLGRAEAAVGRGRLAARTPTFALYDASVEWDDGGAHRSIYLRYALLVDRGTGGLRVFCWPTAESPADREPPPEVVAVPPGASFTCGIHVKAERALGGLPVSWLFAMTELPPGERRPLPDSLREWSVADPATAEASEAMERALRGALLEGRAG
jgi:hypothetical protein